MVAPPQTQTQPPQQGTQPRYELTDDDRKRQEHIAKAWQAYDGMLPKPLKETPEGIDPNVMSNLCEPIVNTGINFLFGKELEITPEENAPKVAADILNKAWGRKEARIPRFLDLAMNGALARNAFLRIVPSKDNPKYPGKPKTYRLVPIDPSIVSVQTAPQDCETVLVYHLEYSTPGKDSKGKPTNIWYCEEICRIDPDGNALREQPDDDDTWEMQHWTRIGDRGAWVAVDEEPIAWPYPFAPLFHCKNLPRPNSFWGHPDVPPGLIGMNQSLNLVESCVSLIELIYGQPILYTDGDSGGTIQIQPGVVIQLPSQGQEIKAVQIISDIANALAFIENLISSMEVQSGVPGIALARLKEMPRGNISGVALELMFMALLAKTATKQCTYGKLIIDVSQALLVLHGLSPDIDISLSWVSPLPSGDLQDIQAGVMMLQGGVSKTTVQRRWGIDPDEEQDLVAQEAQKQLKAQTRGQGLPVVPMQQQQPNQPGQPPQTPQEQPQQGEQPS